MWCAYYAFYEFLTPLVPRPLSPKVATLLNVWLAQLRSSFIWWSLEGAAIFSERPVAIHRDREGRLHGDGQMACAFADGWGVFARHGVLLPEKYGSVPAEDWQARWLLSETNAELRRVLIEGMGYERILKDLDAKHLETWREYNLYRIDGVDVEPVALCAMTCPSTGRRHVLRVRPGLSIREAMTEVNHGVDPERFLVER